MNSTGMLGGSADIGLETAWLPAGRAARVTIGARNRDRVAAAVKQLGDRAQAVAVDAGQADSLPGFFAQAGPISDPVLTVTRRRGAGPALHLAEADLLGAFAGKTVAHLRAVALTLARAGVISPEGGRHVGAPRSLGHRC